MPLQLYYCDYTKGRDNAQLHSGAFEISAYLVISTPKAHFAGVVAGLGEDVHTWASVSRRATSLVWQRTVSVAWARRALSDRGKVDTSDGRRLEAGTCNREQRE